MNTKSNFQKAEALPELSEKQLLAAALIAQGRKKYEAAEAADVTPQTISEWMRQKRFTDAIEALRTEMIYATRDRIRGLGLKAVKTLEDLMDNGSPSARYAAAKDVLDRINLTPGTGGADMGLWAPTVQKEEVELRPFIEAVEETSECAPEDETVANHSAT